VRAYVVPAASVEEDPDTDIANSLQAMTPEDVIVVGINTIRVVGPNAKDLIATILAHLNGVTHADPR